MKRLFTLLMVMLSLLLWNCSGNEDKDIDNPDKGGNEKPENVALDLSVTDLVFEATGGKKEFIVRSNTDWTIENTSSWCQLSTDKGRTDEAVTVSVGAYTGMEDRNTNLTVKSGTTTKILSVTQKRKDAIVLSKDKFDVPQQGGNIDIEVKSNIQYEVTIPSEYKDWIKETVKSKAIETKNFSFTISANEDYSKRNGYIVFEGNGVKDTVMVYQAQIDQLILTKDRCNVSSSEQNLEVELRTNVDFEVVIPDSVAGWISVIQTRAIRTDKVNLSIGENEGYDFRNAVIIFKDKNSELTDTLRIRQAQKNAIIIGQKKYDLPQQGGNITVEVQSNIQYQVTIPTKFQSWIKRTVKTKALETRDFSFTISANGEVEQREGYIVFEGYSIKDTVKVLQEADTRKLILSNRNYDIPAEGKKVEIQLRTNIDFEVVIPDSVSGWINILQTRAMRTEYVNISIGANEGYNSRQAVIIFKDKNSHLTDTLKINQAQKDAKLILYQKNYDIPQKGGNIKVGLNTNIDYGIIIPDSVSDWVSRIEIRAMRTEYVNFNIKVNEHYNPRQAVIIFKDKKSEFSDTIRIQQAQKDTIIFKQKEYEIKQEGGDITVEVQSNTDYKVSIPEIYKGWIKQAAQPKGLNANNFNFIISANETYNKREGFIVFEGNSVRDTIKINQAQTDYINISREYYEIAKEGQDLTVELNTNVPYDVIIPDSVSAWISQIPTKSIITDQIQFHFNINTGRYRKAIIVIKSRNSDLFKTLKITQIGKKFYIGNLSIYSESQLDLIKGYSGIDGNLDINWSSLTTLEQLKDLEIINGSLIIYDLQIRTLEGLENLHNIEGDLFIQGNKVLTTLEQLKNIQRIGKSLAISDAPMLLNLKGLDNIESIGDGLSITSTALTDLKELKNIREVVGHLSIANNPQLTSLKGLDNIKSFNNKVWIHNNEKLTSLKELGNLENIGKDLDIYNTPLINLEGLNNLRNIGGYLNFSGTQLVDLEGLNSLESLEGLYIQDNNLLTSLEGLRNVKKMNFNGRENITIVRNPLLQNLKGLEYIKHVRNLYIGDNRNLTSLEGLENLMGIDVSIGIGDCPELSNIKALSNIRTGQPYTTIKLKIFNCVKLYDFTPLFSFAKDSRAKFEISGNGYNPTQYGISLGQGKPQQ